MRQRVIAREDCFMNRGDLAFKKGKVYYIKEGKWGEEVDMESEVCPRGDHSINTPVKNGWKIDLLLLSVELKVVESTLHYKVLHQDPWITNLLREYRTPNGWCIDCAVEPELSVNNRILYLRGEAERYNNNTGKCKFRSKEEALKVRSEILASLQYAINEFKEKYNVNK